MPGMSGLEVLEILRREDPHARVVMVTKSEEDLTMTEAIGRRVDAYLVKPTSPRQVLSVVTRILEGFGDSAAAGRPGLRCPLSEADPASAGCPHRRGVSHRSTRNWWIGTSAWRLPGSRVFWTRWGP